MKLSIVIPVYNGALSIAALVEEVFKEIKTYELEIILVNDCSKDNSEEVCEKLAANNLPARKAGKIKFISLRKNFGEHNAVMCGLNYSTGDYVAIIDDDFQNPPKEILSLVDEAKKGFDVVYSKYASKKHHVFRNLGSRVNDLVATALLNKPRNLYLSSFKVIKKEVVDEVIKYTGPFPYIDGLLLRVTRNISTVLVEHNARQEGKSNYTITKLVSLYFNMFFNFSIKPLRVFTISGAVIFIIGIILSIAFIIEWLLYPDTPRGWTSVMVAILTFSGFQTMFIGLLGEYLGKQYLDQNGTPQWVVKKEIM